MPIFEKQKEYRLNHLLKRLMLDLVLLLMGKQQALPLLALEMVYHSINDEINDEKVPEGLRRAPIYPFYRMEERGA